MNSISTLFFAFLTFCLFSQTEIECICSTDQTPSGVMVSHVHPKNEWMFSYRYMNMNMSGNIEGTNSIDDVQIFQNYLAAPKTMVMDMHMIMGMYGVSDKVTGMVMFNYLDKKMSMNMLPTNPNSGHNHSSVEGHEMRSSGLSDIQLSVLYGVISNKKEQLIVSSEINIPIGSIEKKGGSDDMMYPSKRYPYNMQIGTGNFSITPQLTYLREFGDKTFSVQASNYFNVFNNVLGYKYGNRFHLTGWYSMLLGSSFSSSVRVSYTLENDIVGSDKQLYSMTEPASNSANYGGSNLVFLIGSSYHFAEKHRVALELGSSIYQQVNGIQMKNRFTLNLAYNISF